MVPALDWRQVSFFEQLAFIVQHIQTDVPDDISESTFAARPSTLTFLPLAVVGLTITGKMSPIKSCMGNLFENPAESVSRFRG